MNAVTVATLVVAWMFVLSRIVHAYIHVGSNHVPARRRAFLVGCGMVVVLAGLALYALVAG